MTIFIMHIFLIFYIYDSLNILKINISYGRNFNLLLIFKYVSLKEFENWNEYIYLKYPMEEVYKTI